jgi:hypothetical protein
MLRRLAFAAILVPLVAAPAAAGEPTTITAVARGDGLHVTVHGVTDYCVTHAETSVLRAEGVIRIVRERPWRVSRCFATRDVELDVAGVGPGTWLVTYEQVPLVAPARPIRVAHATTVVTADPVTEHSL